MNLGSVTEDQESALPPPSRSSQDPLVGQHDPPHSSTSSSTQGTSPSSSPTSRHSGFGSLGKQSHSSQRGHQFLPFGKDPENYIRNTEETAPWKYVGYRIFSRWMATDSALLVFRQFSTLNARVALLMQDEIVQLENKLDRMDKVAIQHDQDRNIQNGTFRNDPLAERAELIKCILPEKLARYNAFMNGYAQMLSRPGIHKDDLASVRKWIETNPKAIDEREAEYILREDLIGIQPKPRSCFRNVIEATFLLKAPFVRGWFERRPQDAQLIEEATKTTEKGKSKTTWPNDKRVERLSSTVIAIIGLGMLVGPLWILAKLSDTRDKLGVISGFIALFFVLIGVGTRAGIFNALASAAAYSAVLMVFVQASQVLL